jgi:hypothetical protein
MSSGRYRYTITKPVWENVPAGTYVLRLTGVEDGPTFSNRKTGAPEPTIKLLLEVDRGPQQGMGLSALVNPDNWGPKANATRWAEAFIGHELEEAEAVDFELYVGECVQARVVEAPDSKGILRNRVDVVMAMAAIEVQTAGARPTPAAAVPAGVGVGAGSSSGAARRPVAAGPAGPRLGRGLELQPDRTLELPDDDPGWDAMEPPPAEDGAGSY